MLRVNLSRSIETGLRPWRFPMKAFCQPEMQMREGSLRIDRVLLFHSSERLRSGIEIHAYDQRRYR